MLLGSVSLALTLPAAASDAAAAGSATVPITIRVVVTPVTRTIKDAPPKTIRLAGDYTKGDTIRGTSILRNAVPQFGKPKGARVGTGSFVITALSSRRAKADGVATFPGGTVRVRGVGTIDANPKAPIVGGTGLYAGATGAVEGRVLPSGAELNVYRMRVP